MGVIKGDLLTESDKLAEVSLVAAGHYSTFLSNAEITDDFGRVRIHGHLLVSKAFTKRLEKGRTDVSARRVMEWFAEYERVGLIRVYEHDGSKYGEWWNWQPKAPSHRRMHRAPEPPWSPHHAHTTSCEKSAKKWRFAKASLVAGVQRSDSNTSALGVSNTRTIGVSNLAESVEAISVVGVETASKLASTPCSPCSPSNEYPPYPPAVAGGTTSEPPPTAATPDEARAVALAHLGPPDPDLQRTGDQQGDFDLPDGLGASEVKPPPNGRAALEADVEALAAYAIRLGGHPGRRDRRAYREALRAGHQVERLRAEIAETVKGELVRAGTFDWSAPWPPAEAERPPPREPT